MALASLNPNYPSMQKYLADHTSCPTCNKNDVLKADLKMNPRTETEWCPECHEQDAYLQRVNSQDDGSITKIVDGKLVVESIY